MMKINFVCVGDLKDKFYIDAAREYLKRLSRFAKTTVLEIAEKRNIEEEADAVLRALKGHIVVLAVEGKKQSSEEFARGIAACMNRGEELTFVIGSSEGLSSRVKARADEMISFSDMTFPHRLMRIILLEQVYRAFMINTGAKYHK